MEMRPCTSAGAPYVGNTLPLEYFIAPLDMQLAAMRVSCLYSAAVIDFYEISK
jgi:hypothetical protein